jgi:hypothetical protein
MSISTDCSRAPRGWWPSVVGRYRGQAFEMLPDSPPGLGTLHAVVVEPTGITEACRLLEVARAGRVTDHPPVHYRSG